ncbi:hypothetical protein [Ralstonia mannitolilytica]|uniref:hypothetical protein n=1 Tax=Ralstonia mannitolilytica TaxID=105219 RepID=UPI003749D1B6
MNEFVKTLLWSAGSSVVLSGALVWLLRIWIGERVRGAIQAEYAEKLESLKAALKAQGDVELEKLRSTLAIAAVERNALTNSLVQRRFDAIAAVHGPLLHFYRAVADLVDPVRLAGGPTDAERQKAVLDAWKSFNQAFLEQTIFLTAGTASMIAEIRQLLVSNANLFNMVVSNERSPDRTAKWIEVHESVSGKVRKAISTLEAELRGLMGDKESFEESTNRR